MSYCHSTRMKLKRRNAEIQRANGKKELLFFFKKNQIIIHIHFVRILKSSCPISLPFINKNVTVAESAWKRTEHWKRKNAFNVKKFLMLTINYLQRIFIYITNVQTSTLPSASNFKWVRAHVKIISFHLFFI